MRNNSQVLLAIFLVLILTVPGCASTRPRVACFSDVHPVAETGDIVGHTLVLRYEAPALLGGELQIFEGSDVPLIVPLTGSYTSDRLRLSGAIPKGKVEIDASTGPDALTGGISYVLPKQTNQAALTLPRKMCGAQPR